MSYPANLSFIIRDGLEEDIPACLAIDHHYETDYVWQMSIQPETHGWQISFRIERLPRPVEHVYPSEESNLMQALETERGFLVASIKDEPDILGYLTMVFDPVYGIAQIQDLVVSRPYRRVKVGTRLLSVARRWALERGAEQLHIATQTKNYPSILFYQNNGLSFCGYNDQYFPNQDIAVFFGQPLR